MSRLTSGILAVTMLTWGAALAKLPPPTPEEQAAEAAKKEKKAKEAEHQKAALTRVQDRIARQYHQEHGTRPSAESGKQTPAGKLPRYAADPPGQGGPSPDHPVSQEAHSSPPR